MIPSNRNRLLLVCVTLLALTGQTAAQATGVPAVPAPPSFDKSNPAKYGRQIADYVDVRDAGWIDSYSKSQMTLIDARGDKVKRDVTQMVLEGKDGNKSISRFMSPADIRGVSALTHEHPKATDDSWLYLPASRRVRRISGANRTASFQGTEFTYEDLSTVEPARYDWKYLGDGSVKSDGKSAKVYKLEAIPNYRDTGYSRLVFYMNQKDWRGEKVEYYDKAGVLLKTLVFSQWKHHHGRFWRANVLSMENQQTRKRTILQVKAQFLNLSMYKKKDGSPRDNLTEAKFTRRALEGG